MILITSEYGFEKQKRVVTTDKTIIKKQVIAG